VDVGAVIYDFTKADEKETQRMATELAEELATELRKIAAGYVVSAWTDVAIVDESPIMILVRFQREGEKAYWCYGFNVPPVADSEQLKLEILNAFRRLKAKRDNEIGVTQCPTQLDCGGNCRMLAGHEGPCLCVGDVDGPDSCPA
jgi:hypothetical protein